MKKLMILFIVTIVANFGLSVSFKASSQDVPKETKYRRSSLHLILMESEKFPKKDTVVKSYINAPFPDKYDNHNIGTRSFDPKLYTVTDEDRAASGKKKKGLLGSLTKSMVSDATGGIVDTSKADTPILINKYFQENKIANQLVAKWFNRQPDGSFDANLICERGAYDATEMAASIAKGSSKGKSLLFDAGKELISNTFIVVSNFNFKANEPVAAAIRDIAKLKIAEMKNPLLQAGAIKAADAVYEKTKEGYSVWTTSYLFKLVWNDTIQKIFNEEYVFGKDEIDPKKKEAFDKSDIFKLEFIGDENASALVMFSLKEKRTEDKIIDIATVRAMDAVFAKLQKKYDVFKPKTPLLTGEPITAKIGLKEGIEGGDKFEVLEQTLDPKTGLTVYNKKGTITVDKNLIWDNRYNAGEEPDNSTAKADGSPAIDRTTFSGGKGFYSGMLIRQLK